MKLAIMLLLLGTAVAQVNLASPNQVTGVLPAAHGGTGNTTGTMPTATALAATPSQCSGYFSTGITATGDANCNPRLSENGSLLSYFGATGISAASFLGNASTATALAATPGQCGNGFSTGNTANGDANCDPRITDDGSTFTYSASGGISAPQFTATASGSANHAVCWKSGGTLGYCSNAVQSDGTCTCQ